MGCMCTSNVGSMPTNLSALGGPAEGIGALADAITQLSDAVQQLASALGATGAAAGAANVGGGAAGAPVATAASGAALASPAAAAAATPLAAARPARPASTPAATAGPATAAPTSAPAAANVSQDEIRSYLRSVASSVGVNGDLLVEIARLEFGLRPDAVNSRNPSLAANKVPRGMFQYIGTTWDSFNAKARRDLPQLFAGLGAPSHMDWRQQAVTTAWALREGLGSHWSTYRTAKAHVGA